MYSHAEGLGTKTGAESQHVGGSFNEVTSGLFIIGNGTDDTHRKNALVLDNAGNLHVSGNITCDGILKENNTSAVALASLDEDEPLTQAQVSQQIYSVGISPPANTNLFWIDTTPESTGLKYFDGSDWKFVPFGK